MGKYKQISRTEDVAALIHGYTESELFENAAYAMFDLMADLKGLTGTNAERIEADASDMESLMIVWLNEVLYAAYRRSVLFFEFKVLSLDKNKLLAEAKGQKIEDDDRIKLGIKAAERYGTGIKKTVMGYEAAVVFDV